MTAVAVARPDASAQQPGPAYSKETIAAQVEAANELRSTLQRALDAGEKRVTISSRVYRFEGNLDFSDLDGVTIDGQGAEFVFTRGMVRLQSCRNVTAKNLFLDVEPLPFVQGTVVALDSQAKTVDMRLDPGYPAEAACSRKDGLRCVFFDPKEERELEIIDTTTPPPVEVSPGVVRIHSRRIFDAEKRPLAAGDRVVLSVKTGAGGVSVTDCANVTLEDITIYAAGRFAITESGLAEGGNTYRRCRVVRRPGSGRLMAGAADGFHSITQKKGPHLVDCEIAHCFDDLVNIHGFFSLALERRENGAWLIAGPGGQDFAIGSVLRFYRAPDAEPLGEARVVACERRDAPAKDEIEGMVSEHFKRVCGRSLRSFPHAQPCEVVLDREVDIEPFDFVSCADFAGAGAVIEDCHFHDGHVRGVLTKSSDSVIRRCRFERLARSGVVIKPEIYWLEGPFPEDVRIEDNTFLDCGFGAVSTVEKSWEFAPLQVISSFSSRLFPPLFSKPVNMRRIQCVDNRIERAPGPGIFIMNAEDVVISRNTIIDPGAKLAEAPATLDLTRNLPPDAVLTDAERDAMAQPAFGILLAGVRNVIGNDNRVEGGPALLGVGWNTAEVAPGLLPPGIAEPPPDYALLPAPLNTAPGPEYGTAARLYQGIPGIARDEASGRLWATWYSGGRGECRDNYVLVVTSGDDGLTWTEPVLVIDPPGPIRAFDECLWTAPDGRLFLFYAQADASGKLHDGRWGVWYTICRDPARADSPWTPPVRICDGIMMNKPTVLRDGTWLVPVAKWNDKSHGAGVVRSRDNGETFDWIGGAGGGGLEHMIVERKDSSLWMLMRRGEGMAESVSRDGGVTWSETTPSSIDGPGSRFFIRRLRSGRLLLVNHIGFAREGNRFLDWRSHLTALLSDDDGKTWPHQLLLDERRDISYPDAVEAPDGRLYIIYDRGRYSDREILMAVIRENDILAGAPGPEARLRVLINKATRPRK